MNRSINQEKEGIYEFGDFRLEIGKDVLLREGQPVSMQWKTFELLCVLVKSNGNLITRDELMNKLWADTFVEENNLSQHIRLLRKALGEGENGTTFIETVPRRGYRFLPEVRILKTADENEVVSRDETRSQIIAEDILDKSVSDSESLAIVQSPTDSFVSGNRSDTKTIAYAAPTNSATIKFDSEIIVKDVSHKPSATKQETNNQPKITKRREGLRRGLKSLLWSIGIGFGVLILFQIFNILGVLNVTNPNYPPAHVRDMIGTLLDTLYIPVGLVWCFGVGLFLFGIIRIIYALFEKENSKLNSSLIEKLIAVIITVMIAAVFIPNMIASYRQAKEYRQSEINKSHQNQIK